MNRRMFALCAILFVTGCGSIAGYSETLTLSATVRHSDLAGGFFYLHGDNGADYDPTNLPTAYQQDGKRVNVKIKNRDDLASVHQFGTMVEILEISAIP